MCLAYLAIRAFFNRKNEIFGPEMLAPLASILINRKKVANKTINLHIDSNNVITWLTRCYSVGDFIASNIACFWWIAEAFAIDIRLGRAISIRNPSDLPTRGSGPPFQRYTERSLENPQASTAHKKIGYDHAMTHCLIVSGSRFCLFFVRTLSR